jgi:hypothetical protein
MSEVSETTAGDRQETQRPRQVDLEPLRQAAEDLLTTGYGLTLLALDGLETFFQRAYDRGQHSRDTAGPLTRMFFDLVRRPDVEIKLQPKEVKVRVLPIADYDALGVNDVVEALEGLDPPDLELVRDYESEHKNRKTVLRAIDQKLAAAVQD